MQSFRASPWVSYEPFPSQQERDQAISGTEVDDDVDMDAPRISTLDEDSPPLPNKKLSKKRPYKATLSGSADQEANENDEDDQLVDELVDDDNPDRLSPSLRAPDTAQKRRISVKKKSRKGERKAFELEKKATAATTPSVIPTISIFKANPTNSDIDMSASSGPIALAEASAPKSKKKVPPRKPNISRSMGKLSKSKSAASHLLAGEDAGVLSESYAGTAASSPVFEQNSPEPENLPPSSPLHSSAPMVDEPPNLENVPIPVYPLPTKPFAVQPPPKNTTGFAPLMPLDRSGTKVRHWREANRDIRGIAGGRWFAKTWVGDKESQFATYAKSIDDKVSTGTTSKLPAQSSGTPVMSKAVSKLKGSSKTVSVANSANPSRAASVIPEHAGNAATSAVRAPTKMRISQKAPSDIESVATTPGGT